MKQGLCTEKIGRGLPENHIYAFQKKSSVYGSDIAGELSYEALKRLADAGKI